MEETEMERWVLKAYEKNVEEYFFLQIVLELN